MKRLWEVIRIPVMLVVAIKSRPLIHDVVKEMAEDQMKPAQSREEAEARELRISRNAEIIAAGSFAFLCWFRTTKLGRLRRPLGLATITGITAIGSGSLGGELYNQLYGSPGDKEERRRFWLYNDIGTGTGALLAALGYITIWRRASNK